MVHSDCFAPQAVEKKFSELCGKQLPSLTLSLVRQPGPSASSSSAPSGATVQFVRAKLDTSSEAAAGGKGGKGSGCDEGSAPQGTLEQLSGGQRTLVSLALFLASAWAGSHSSVLLMDEVDAALDEHNQVRGNIGR